MGASPDPREPGSICVLPLGWSRTHVGGRSPGWRDTPQRSLWVSSSAGAGAAGGREGGDDTAAPLPVHAAAARDGHVQPKREFSALGRGQRYRGTLGRGSHGLCAMVAGYITATEKSVLRVGRDSGLWATSWDGPVSYPGQPRDSIPSAPHRRVMMVKIAGGDLASSVGFLTMLELFKTSQAKVQ